MRVIRHLWAALFSYCLVSTAQALLLVTNPTRQQGLFVVLPSLARRVSVMLLLLCCVGGTAQAAPFSYATHQLQLTDLGAGLNPTAINNVGQVVGQAANSQAFLWASGTTTPLGTMGGTQSYANDINDDGTAVGWSHDAGGQMRAFSWTEANGMVNIGTEFALETAAEAISNNNEIAGWIYNGVGNGYKSARWTEIVPEGEAMFASIGHKALGINDQGNIVGITLQTDGSADEGYFWINSGDTLSFSGGLGLDYFPYAGINNQDMTAGFQSGSAGYLQLEEPLVSPIGKLQVDDDFSNALGLNDLGLIVGESGAKGFLFDQPTATLLDLNLFPRLTPGFGQVLRLTDINNDGTFVGVALIDGVEHGFVGMLVVPEPSSWILIGVGLIGMCIIRNRRQARLVAVA